MKLKKGDMEDPKFSQFEKVWFISNCGIPRRAVIRDIEIKHTVSSKETAIKYRIIVSRTYFVTVLEHRIFQTKQQAMDYFRGSK